MSGHTVGCHAVSTRLSFLDCVGVAFVQPVENVLWAQCYVLVGVAQLCTIQTQYSLPDRMSLNNHITCTALKRVKIQLEMRHEFSHTQLNL
jgi:hypothetical protein